MKLEVNCEKYTFDEAKHKHYINGNEVTGTTTITGVIDKPALMPWGIKMTLEALIKSLKKNWTELSALDKMKFETKFLTHATEAKKEPNNKKTEAGRFGTVVHALCEHFNLTGVLLPVDSPLLSQDVLEKASTFTPKQLQKATKLVEEYIKWFKANKAEILYVEQNVFSETHFVGGIFDMVIKVKGKIYIGDFKTSSGVYPSQFIQIGGYQLQLEEMIERGYIDDFDVHGYIVFHIPRKGGLTVHIKEEVAIYRRAFLACVYIYRVINEQLWAL